MDTSRKGEDRGKQVMWTKRIREAENGGRIAGQIVKSDDWELKDVCGINKPIGKRIRESINTRQFPHVQQTNFTKKQGLIN
jgi:hypothetical protein